MRYLDLSRSCAPLRALSVLVLSVACGGLGCDEAAPDDMSSTPIVVGGNDAAPPGAMVGMVGGGTTGGAGNVMNPPPVGNPSPAPGGMGGMNMSLDSGASALLPDAAVTADAGVMIVDSGLVGDAGSLSDAGMGGDAALPTNTVKPACLKKPSQVVAIGDSYVALPVVLIPKVEALATSAGALTSGQHYRDYSAPGTTLGSPTAPGSIPPQWDMAKRADPDIKVIIMDGGGNDILANADSIFGGCLDPGASKNKTCTDIIEGAIGMARKLALDAKAAGVQDVIYFLYPHVPVGGDEILDYSVDEGKKMAAEVSTEVFRVHLVDTRPPFMGHPEYFDLDPIHANEAGAQQIAKLVWDTMKSKCIAQPASSGCCTP